MFELTPKGDDFLVAVRSSLELFYKQNSTVVPQQSLQAQGFLKLQLR